MAKRPQIRTFTNLKGIDKEVQDIQNLMSFTWLDYSFGVAETLVRDGVSAFPAFFNTNKSDPQDLRPNDNWGAYAFWTYSTPLTSTYADGVDRMKYRKRNVLRTQEISCIFYMNLKKITSDDYKVKKTAIRQDIENFFDSLTSYKGMVIPDQLIDYDIKEVFNGFDLGDLPERWFYLPYYAVRVDMEIQFYSDCS